MAAALAASLLTGMGCVSTHPRRPTSGAVGRTLELSLPTLDGRQVDVAADRGRVRVIDFWATWCEPCRDALPALDDLARDLGARGLSVYGVSIDEERERIVDFLAAVRVGFPILWDREAEAVARFDASYMPVTLLVDRRGIIRHVHQGWDRDSARKQRQEVEALLAEP